MQRERSRERLERARRQWELENADSINMNNSNNSLPRHNNIPSYEATVLHMVSVDNTLNCPTLLYYNIPSTFPCTQYGQSAQLCVSLINLFTPEWNIKHKSNSSSFSEKTAQLP